MHLNKWNTRWDFIFFDISKQLVAYKHTYFVQRNRMKCGHAVGIYFTCLEAIFHFIYTYVTVPLLYRVDDLVVYVITCFEYTCGI